MGHSSKKKKKGGGASGSGRRNKKGKDQASHADEDNELLSEEITALSAIFQDDCRVVTGVAPQVIIRIRPYSKDMGYEDLDVSALLSVRCLPGYPHKCPKLQVTSEKGLADSDANKLLSLLHEQATSNAREGRVVIYNLVEAAQEFLSEVVPLGQSNEIKDITVSSNRSGYSKGPFVFGFLDLFSSSGETWNWGLKMNDSKGAVPAQSDLLSISKVGSDVHANILDKNAQTLKPQDAKQGLVTPYISRLETLDEDTENDHKTISSSYSSRSNVGEFSGNSTEEVKEDVFMKHVAEKVGDSESEAWESLSSASLGHSEVSESVERDLIMVHLLRLACTPKSSFSDSLPQIATELYHLGIFSESVRKLASKPSSLFNKNFDQVFRDHMVSSGVSQFWKPVSGLEGPNTSLTSSRYLSDFEELHSLGHGGFGHVVLCKNKLDLRQYAVKKIRLKDKNLPVNDRILREVATLSRLQHQHVVRYYQSWYEAGVNFAHGDSALSSRTATSSTVSYRDASITDILGQENKIESTYLYIQMEYCPRTLRQVFESYDHFDKELAWHWFRQIVEGLAHIHGQGIIHRDLTPSNIFFDARSDVKIGDFGLAKFLKLEQLDQDSEFPSDTAGVSVDGLGLTGQVGTYFYTAPEIEQGWPKIDEKADMYSLGVVFFELWHPFATAMERHIVLSDLKQKDELPQSWIAEFPEQALLLQRLMSHSPSERPSATELLHDAFPPRMEHELLDDILQTMQTSEDTSVYDKVVNTIFDEEKLEMKSHRPLSGSRLRIDRDEKPSIHYTDVDTELRDYVTEFTREVFRKHCARHLEVIPMGLLDDSPDFNRRTVKLLTNGGDLLELCHELRLPFVSWIITNQKSSFKRYEISSVYRRAIGHSPPNRYLQGDFDIVGGSPVLTEAEIIKVAVDILRCFFHPDRCDIHVNHGDLLEVIWSWVGIKSDHRHKVAELLSMMGSLRPQSPEWKLKWAVMRRQLLQELNLAEAVVNRLQTVGLRFCGADDQALPRLRGALPSDKQTQEALDQLSHLFNYLRVWKIQNHVYIDPLMPPTENYHRDLYFQVYLTKEENHGSLIEGAVLAVGGRYDYLLRQMWDHESAKTNPPGAVGVSLALETIIQYAPVDLKPMRNEASTSILVCSRGGGGLLVERMELVSELWEENIKAEYVPIPDPSLKEQYEYANEHDIRCLVIITDAGLSQTGFVKVRQLELKKEKEVEREKLIKFLLDAMATQFRNPSVWI